MGDFDGDLRANAVFNNMMRHVTGNDVLETGIKTTNRSTASKRRLQEKQSAMWIPRRCEFPGCDKTGSDDLSYCQKCRCAFYCSVEHQKAQWPTHKLECKHMARKGITAVHYTTEEELRKFPIGCFPLSDEACAALPEACFVCGATEEEVNLGKTRCCNMWVCDNEHEYQMMSYSRDHCIRSHDRYTMCSTHSQNRHHGDWRTCTDCSGAQGSYNGSGRDWHSTNGFNITPGLTHVYPQGSSLTVKCSACPRRILEGHDGYSTSLTAGGRTLLCDSCMR